MAVANRNADKQTASKRWFKFATYLIITGTVIVCIWWKLFFWVSCLIAVLGYYEIVKTFNANKKAASIAIFIYSLIITGFLSFVWQTENSILLHIYFQVLIFDAFSQITGQLGGRNPIAKSISPTKTIEGFAGGVLFCILSVVLLSSINSDKMLLIFIGLITSIASFSGDILASFYKRQVGIKDFSNILPGQGGILDRFDSLLMTGFVYYCLGLFSLLKLQF